MGSDGWISSPARGIAHNVSITLRQSEECAKPRTISLFAFVPSYFLLCVRWKFLALLLTLWLQSDHDTKRLSPSVRRPMSESGNQLERYHVLCVSALKVVMTILLVICQTSRACVRYKRSCSAFSPGVPSLLSEVKQPRIMLYVMSSISRSSSSSPTASWLFAFDESDASLPFDVAPEDLPSVARDAWELRDVFCRVIICSLDTVASGVSSAPVA